MSEIWKAKCAQCNRIVLSIYTLRQDITHECCRSSNCPQHIRVKGCDRCDYRQTVNEYEVTCPYCGAKTTLSLPNVAVSYAIGDLSRPNDIVTQATNCDARISAVQFDKKRTLIFMEKVGG